MIGSTATILFALSASDETDAAEAALAVSAHIFQKAKDSYTGIVIE